MIGEVTRSSQFMVRQMPHLPHQKWRPCTWLTTVHSGPPLYWRCGQNLMWQCSIFSCMFTFSSCRVHPFMFILWSHIVHKKFTWIFGGVLILFMHCSLGVHLVFILCSWVASYYITFHQWIKLFLNLQVVYFSEIISFFPTFSHQVNKSWTQDEHCVNTKWTMLEQKFEHC
jgi:hypothetical protein